MKSFLLLLSPFLLKFLFLLFNRRMNFSVFLTLLILSIYIVTEYIKNNKKIFL